MRPVVACQHIWNGTEWVPSTGSGGAGGGGSTEVAVSNFPQTQAVSGTVSVAGYVAPSTQVSVSGTVPVSGPLTDAQLRATPVPVAGSTQVAVSAVAGTVRAWAPDSTTFSGQASSAGDNVIGSSAATALYVYGYCLSGLSTAAQLMRFLNGSTNETWRVRTLGGSTVGVQAWPIAQSVTPPSYLFRTAAGNPLVLNVTSSGVNYSVAAWREA